MRIFSELVLTLSALVLIASTVHAQETLSSRISVPFSVPLADLQAYAEATLPNPLHRNSSTKTCIKAERACTKIPEFRGFKIYSRTECIDVTPRVRCEITERVAREGAMRISGNGAQLNIAQDIYATATVKGTGALGANIRQTVRAKAEVKVISKFGVSLDWTPRVPTEISHRWIQRPEFRLFNLFPISLGSKLSEKLDPLQRQLEQKIPAELAKMNLRGALDKVWSEVQKPHPLSNVDGVQTYLHLRPFAMGLAGPTFEGNRLNARLDMRLRASVTDTPRGPVRTRLPENRPQPASTTSLRVPVTLGTASLNRVIARQLPTTVQGMTVTKAILRVEDDQLVLDTRLNATLLGLNLQDQQIELRANLAYSNADQSVEFSNIDLSVHDDGAWFTNLARAALIELLELFLQNTIAFSLKEDIAKFEASVKAALNREIAPGLRLSGGGKIGIQSLRLRTDANAIEAVLAAEGAVRITGFNPLGK